MASQTDIINLAIYKLAQSVLIPSLSDESKAADVFRQLWEPMRDLVLTDRVWPWAMRAVSLATAPDEPQIGWTKRYAYPNDCLTARAVTNAQWLGANPILANYANDSYLGQIWGHGAFDWETSYGEQGQTINSNTEGAYLVYVVRVEDPVRYPPQFVNALATRLAAEGAPPMLGEVGLNNKTQLLQEYTLALTNASSHGLNEAESQSTYVTPSLAARG